MAHLPTAWMVAGAALLAAWLGRRRWPSGVGESLFAVGLSGALLAEYVPPRGAGHGLLRLVAALTALAVLWYLVLRWIERGATASATVSLDSPPEPNARRLVGAHLVHLCGLLVAAASLCLPADADDEPRLGATVCLLVLAVLALRRYTRRTVGGRPLVGGESGPLSGYAVMAVLGCALRLWVPPGLLRPHEGKVSAGLVGVAVATLAAALWPALAHWWHRRRVWRTQPERLLDSAPQRPVLLGIVTALAGLVGVGGLLTWGEPASPLAVFIACLAAFVAAHQQRNDAAGELGLVLVAGGIILAVAGWLPASGLNALLGCALAGAYLLWLSGFWRQQLHDGRPWTTAGRLIEPARHLGHAAACGCFVLALAAAVEAPADSAEPIWLSLPAAGLLALLAGQLVRDAAAREDVGAGFLACLAALAASVPLRQVAWWCGWLAPWPIVGAAMLVLLALYLGRDRSDRLPRVAYNAYIGGLAPVAAVYAFGVPAAYGSRAPWVVGVVTAGLLALAAGIRWRPAPVATLRR